MKLFACMCNQPQRLAAALAPVRAALVARRAGQPLGPGVHAGRRRAARAHAEVAATARRSRRRRSPRSRPTARSATRCATPPARRRGTDNTPPFRFRRWMFALTGRRRRGARRRGAAAASSTCPSTCGATSRGRTPAELDVPRVPRDAARRGLRRRSEPADRRRPGAPWPPRCVSSGPSSMTARKPMQRSATSR